MNTPEEEPNVLSITDFAAGLRIAEEETAVVVKANRVWKHPTSDGTFVVRVLCPFCSEAHVHGWAGPGYEAGYVPSGCRTDDFVGDGYQVVVPSALRASEAPRNRASPKKRAWVNKTHRQYRDALEELNQLDHVIYRAIVARVESFKGMARRDRDRAIIAESRLLVAEAELNTRTTELENI